MNLAELLAKITIKDAVTFGSIGALAYHTYLCYGTLKSTAHRHSEDSSFSYGVSSENILSGDDGMDYEFGFQASSKGNRGKSR